MFDWDWLRKLRGLPTKAEIRLEKERKDREEWLAERERRRRERDEKIKLLFKENALGQRVPSLPRYIPTKFKQQDGRVKRKESYKPSSGIDRRSTSELDTTTVLTTIAMSSILDDSISSPSPSPDFSGGGGDFGGGGSSGDW